MLIQENIQTCIIKGQKMLIQQQGDYIIQQTTHTRVTKTEQDFFNYLKDNNIFEVEKSKLNNNVLQW